MKLRLGGLMIFLCSGIRVVVVQVLYATFYR